jgi:hypothetical protein
LEDPAHGPEKPPEPTVRSKLYVYTGVSGVSCTAPASRFGTLACGSPGFGVAALGR